MLCDWPCDLSRKTASTVVSALEGAAGMEHAMSLYRAWADAYGLSPDSLLPPSPLSLPPSLPPAPHLEDCAALTALRQQAEQWGEGGEPPAWADPQPAQGVRGAPEGGAQGEGEGGAACCRRAASGEASGEFKASVTVGAAAAASASPPLTACCSCVPQPPWVRGADSDNLALTRVVQRDVWEWQFPPSCVSRRLLVVPWPEDQWHGMGSQ
ncbi:unnamed protein product, partial [Closterium sp. Naga37s-1]